MKMVSVTLALNRFGLGARPDETLPADPKAWLSAQLGRFDPLPPPIAAAPRRREVAMQLADYLAEQRMARAARREPGDPPRFRPASMAEPGMQAMAADAAMPPKAQEADPAVRFLRKAVRDQYLAFIGARMNAALVSPAPFLERLAHFWANHFAVSADKLTVVGLAGLLEFEAVRPNLLGKFGDMLLAVEQHPAMLLYLDQAQSIGPNSFVGERAARRQRKAGLNENLAREILELHTLGVRSGYSQADVTEFARALTGWTVDGLARGAFAWGLGGTGTPGDFLFSERLHEPGPRIILGRTYDQPGEGQARAVLADLAVHPATARHVATKLARHFAADDPPPGLVDRLTRTYLASAGDLPSLYRVLIDAPEVWNPANVKFRTPWDWSVAALRAVGSRQIQPQAAAGLLRQLGQDTWKPGSPAGYDDIAQSWAGPEALVRRVEAAERLASRAGDAIDARQLGPKLMPDGLSAATGQALARAESPGQGLALLLASPEFLRR
jgi:uncharacterized protein (DUF1800 family)